MLTLVAHMLTLTLTLIHLHEVFFLLSTNLNGHRICHSCARARSRCLAHFFSSPFFAGLRTTLVISFFLFTIVNGFSYANAANTYTKMMLCMCSDFIIIIIIHGFCDSSVKTQNRNGTEWQNILFECHKRNCDLCAMCTLSSEFIFRGDSINF